MACHRAVYERRAAKRQHDRPDVTGQHHEGDAILPVRRGAEGHERRKGQACKSEPKTKLQELAAKLGVAAPEYTITHDGPDHDRTFTASLMFSGRVFIGSARSKRDAETEAALAALTKLS